MTTNRKPEDQKTAEQTLGHPRPTGTERIIEQARERSRKMENEIDDELALKEARHNILSQVAMAQPAATVAPTTAEIMLSPLALESMEKASNLMAISKSMMPKHLRNNPGDCMGILMQAAQWKMNPFALAQKTFEVNGVIGYEAQAIKAAVDSSPQLVNRLDFQWFGDWDKLLGKIEWKKGQGGKPYPSPNWSPEDEANVGVICRGLLRGEEEPRELVIRMTQAYPRNSTLWATDPRQQIAYLASKRWARLHLPERLLGVYDYEEALDIQEVNITPAEEPIRQPKPKAKRGATVEGSASVAKRSTRKAEKAEKDVHEQAALCQEICGELDRAESPDECEAIRKRRSGQLIGEYNDRAKQRYLQRMDELSPREDQAQPKREGEMSPETKAEVEDFFKE